MKKKSGRFIFWAPRILALLFILFLAMFSLDIFEGNYGFWGTILGLLMHNLPALILLAALLVSWKHELVGSMAFFLFGILYMGWLAISMFINPPFQGYFFSWSLIIAGPAFLVGVLFLIGWLRKKKRPEGSK